MKQEQYFDFDSGSQSSPPLFLQKTIAGMKYALLIAGLAIVSFVLVSLVSLVLNVFHEFHTMGVLPRLRELEASPRYMLYLWFIVTCDGVFVVFLAVWWSIKPICILRYLRQLKREEMQDAELYIPLKVVPADPTGGSAIGREDQSQALDLIAWAQQQQDSHLLLLGPRGSGKTMFLHVYQDSMLKRLLKIIFRRQRIPAFVSLEAYYSFIYEEPAHNELADFLSRQSSGIRYIRRYVQKLIKRGRFVLLCDDVNAISSRDLDVVCSHLISLMIDTQNRLIITCQEIDYNEQEPIRDLVANGNALPGSIRLPEDQVEAFIRKYLASQSNAWRHSAEQILQIINSARLIPLCTNPSSLLTLMQVIDQVGIEGEHVLDTRGLLVQEFVLRKIDRELKGEWSNAGLTSENVLQFLSELAYVMHWAGGRNEVDLSLSLEEGPLDYEILAEELLVWLITQRPQEPFIATQGVQPGLFHDSFHKRTRARLLQFARALEFISVRPGGILSFKHKLIADYLAAKYLYFLTQDSRWQTLLPLNEAFLSEGTLERWREPFAFWAGLIADPGPLVDRIAQVGQGDPGYAAPALMLCLVCMGAKQQRSQPEVYLPQGLRQMLLGAVDNKNTRKELAPVFDRCAAEMGQWVYEILLPLLTTKGIEHLMLLLNKEMVPRLLFRHLVKIADEDRYNIHREHLIRILRQFGSQGHKDVIDRAAKLSQPAPQRSLQLRKAVIDILGYTQDKFAVEQLMLLLQDPQEQIRYASSSALARIGPSLVLEPLIKELRLVGSRAHIPVLGILGNFLTEQHQGFQLKDVEYLRILQELVPVLSSKYPLEARECACELLKKLVQSTTDETKQRLEKIVGLLLSYLESPDKALGNNVVEVLKEVGEFATPYLLQHIQRSQLEPITRRRIVEVFSYVRDPRALDELLRLVADESDEVFHLVKFAFQHYAIRYPVCIPRLIELVLDHPRKDVAARAAEILENLDAEVVEPVIAALPTITPGRTEKLVHVLERSRDERAIPALIDLLHRPQVRYDTSLALTVIIALGEFRDERVVPPLLKVLAISDDQLISEAVEVLSNLEEIAFHQLIAALNVPQETEVTSRIRQVLIRMKSSLERTPFNVDEELFHIFAKCSDELARQIRFVFRERGVVAAPVLIQHIPDPDVQVRERVLGMLYAMDKSDVIYAFVTALRRPRSELAPELLSEATQYLKLHDESIPYLVNALSDPQWEAISKILLEFGPRLLRSNAMIEGLNEAKTRERLQHIIKTLGLQQPEEVVAQIIDLFSLIKHKDQNSQAYTALVDLLAGDLAGQSVPYLLEALEKPEVVYGVAAALQRLAGRFETQNEVINGLIQSLRSDERRRTGAKEALVRLVQLGTKAVSDKAIYPVGDLIADDDRFVAEAAKDILISVGPPAFPVIWSALSDIDRNPGRQGAGRDILCAMPTHVIKDKLVDLLSSPRAAEIEMAVTLLLELIQNEPRRSSGDQKMIPALLASIHEKSSEHTKLRILTLLLLWGGSDVAEFLVQTLRSNPKLDERFAEGFLLLRKETAEKKLQDVVQDKTGALSPQLRAQLAGILGMIKPELVGDYAKNIAAYGLVDGNSRQVKNPNQLGVSLRALGALLVSGSWNAGTLGWMREHADAGTPQRELFDILLGDLYSPRIKAIEQQKEAQERENKRLEDQLGQARKDFQEISAKLQQSQEALQRVGEELERTKNERDQAVAAAHVLSHENEGLKQQLQAGTGVSI